MVDEHLIYAGFSGTHYVGHKVISQHDAFFDICFSRMQSKFKNLLIGFWAIDSFRCNYFIEKVCYLGIIYFLMLHFFKSICDEVQSIVFLLQVF